MTHDCMYRNKIAKDRNKYNDRQCNKHKYVS